MLGLLFNGHHKENDKVICKGEDLLEYRNSILIESIVNEINNNTNLKILIVMAWFFGNKQQKYIDNLEKNNKKRQEKGA